LTAPDPAPPRYSERLLRLTLPAGVVGESVRGDLLEEFRRRARSGSLREAARWYRRQARSVVWWSLRRRLAGRGVRPRRDAPWPFRGEPMEDLVGDLRLALRGFALRPSFTAAAVLILALAIGVNVCVFSVLNVVLLRPLPVSHPEELLSVYTSEEKLGNFGTSSYADFVDLRRHNTVFTDLAAHSLTIANLSGEHGPELVLGEIASWNYFPLLGIRPALGRFFLPEEDRSEGSSPVTVLSHGFWQRRFDGDSEVIGKSVRLNGAAYTVVGVAPRSFRGALPGFAAELWLPTMMAEQFEPVGWQDVVASPSGTTIVERRGRRWLSLTGRLEAGVSLEQAESALASIMAGLAVTYPVSNAGRTARLLRSDDVRLHPSLDGTLRPAGTFLLGVVGLVLLIACANVASLLLARATGRRREIALRRALGAGRLRIVRQLLTESLVLAVAGGVLGTLLAVWGTRLLLRLELPVRVSFTFDASPDLRVLAFATILTLATGVLFGLAPALRSSGGRLVGELKGGSVDGDARSRPRLDLRRALVVAQVAVSLVLLVGTGLLIRGLHSARQHDLGFEPDRLAILGLNLDLSGYSQTDRRRFYDELLARVRVVPEVQSAALVSRLPFSMNFHEAQVYPGSHRPEADPGTAVDVTAVDASYFETLGVPLLEGRGFDARDHADSSPVAVVSAAFAERFFPGESAVGKHVTRRYGGTYEIVGVARDYAVRWVDEAPRAYVHFAHSQSDEGATLLVRSATPREVLATLRRQALEIDPELVLTQTTTMLERIEVTLFAASAGATLLGALGLFGLLLASVGLYGVVAFSVSGRTREIGIRMALGASRRDVLGLVLGDGLKLVLLGAAIGLPAAAALSRSLSSVLYGTSPVDPLAYGAGALVLLLVAFAANLVPARRAAGIEPMSALRYD
jgi:predicted permease